MPPRTLSSLAHALTVSADAEGALAALGEALAEVDRVARLALVHFDERREMLGERVLLTPNGMERVSLDTTFDHLPSRERTAIGAGGQFVDFADSGDEFARLFQIPSFGSETGWLNVRGLRFDGHLTALLVLYETRKLFGARTAERFLPAIALFELAYLRFLERGAREEAVRTLEDVTQRVHGEYEARLGELATRMEAASGAPAEDSARVVALERELARATEDARRALKRAEIVDATVASAVEQLEKAHVELHRRSEAVRQKTRTIYLIDKVLTLDASTDDPRQLADGLLSLVGDEMHANRCSLMLRTPEGNCLYIAAAKGVAPGVMEGLRVAMGQGVAGRVAQAREPVLVRDATEAHTHPLLQDGHFTTGSFISFPLVYHDELVGVVNVANRAMQGIFTEEDVDRVRLLGLVISIVASHARLPERLVEALSVR
jgi:GAF domain